MKKTIIVTLTLVVSAGLSWAGATEGKEIYTAKCKGCHGVEGTPPAGMAKAMGIKPMKDVQALTDAQMQEAVLKGKGKMKAVAGVTEKQAAWLETMDYSPAETGPMLRVSSETVEKVRHRASELIRGTVNAWRRTLLVDNGLALGREATAATGADCLPTKTFLDMVDGRTTWRGRDVVDQHLRGCWHCVDHFCRILEAIHLLRGSQPLSQAESAPFRALLGVAEPQRAGWKRLLGGR